MDITVKPAREGNEWSLEDLLGRGMGHIVEEPSQHFTIQPEGNDLWTS